MTTVIKSICANVYEKDSFGSMIVTQGIIWEKVKILEEKGDWLRIVLPDSYEGWVQRFNLQELDPELEQSIAKRKRVLVDEPYLPLKSYTKVDGVYEKQGMAVFGGRFPLKQDKGSWKELWLPDGRSGWIQLPAVPGLSTRDRILFYALKMLGAPYHWGGKSENGYDCSGFVQSLFSACGLTLPRDAWQQKELLAEYPLKGTEVQKGDLAFFQNEKGRINHVAIMMDDSLFIHASGEVKINSFDPEHPLFSEKLKNIQQGSYSIETLLTD